jgi:hypothetical protein
MPTPLHDVFKRSVESAIESQLRHITEHTPFKIISGSHSDVQRRKDRFAIPIFDKSPDGQFYYKSDSDTTDFRYPPFILEVAYSQEERDLRQTATSFLRTMPGQICTILAIDIEYLRQEKRRKNCHTASLSLWTTRKEQGRDGALRLSCSTHEFRDKDGRALPGELVLPLDFFLPLDKRSENSTCGDSADSDIRLSFSRLSEFIDEAEERQRIFDATPTPPLRPKRINTLIWEDGDGDVTEEKLESEPKRQKTGPEPAPTIRTRSRTRSLSQPRRSERIRSASRG